MKKLFLLLALITAPAYASEVYFGVLPDSSLRAQPNGTSKARYTAGLLVDKDLGDLVPRAKIETLMDRTNGDVSFHPASVRYEVGVELQLNDGWYADLSRNCWHTIDGYGTEDYWMLKAGVRW